MYNRQKQEEKLVRHKKESQDRINEAKSMVVGKETTSLIREYILGLEELNSPIVNSVPQQNGLNSHLKKAVPTKEKEKTTGHYVYHVIENMMLTQPGTRVDERLLAFHVRVAKSLFFPHGKRQFIALTNVLPEHVHFRPMTENEIARERLLVNKWLALNEK